MAVAAPPRTDGPAVCEFIESFCYLSTGEWAGRPMKLRPWQRELIDDLYELRPDGRRRYRTAVIGMPRKNGKSSLGAALALYALIADGEPGAQVYSCAGDRKQAEIVFGEAKKMVQASPELSEVVKCQRYHLEVPSTHSVYRVLSADAKLQQGLNPSEVLFDELHVQPDEDLWTAMTMGSGTRRQPQIVGITTAGFDQESLLYRLYQYGRRVQSGEIDDPSFYFRWWEPSNPNCDWQDPAVWAECNPAYGDFLFEDDFATTVKSTPESEFRRFRLNQWTATHTAWLPHGAWADCEDRGRVVPLEEPIVLGFDGAWSNDSTAIVACTVEHPHLFVVGHWEKPLDDPHWRVDTGEVKQAIIEACRERNVREVTCDPYRWQDVLQVLANEGLPVVEFPTNSVQRMVPACQEFYSAVLEQKITHDGDVRLARHVANANVKHDRFGSRIVKETATSPRKIDLAVAAVIAHARARLAEPASIYEERGLILL
jgi:phage terminase large subunit-like protein